MGTDSSEPIERWTAKRRAALAISILKGETSAAEAARRQGLTIGEIDDWRGKFHQEKSSRGRMLPSWKAKSEMSV